MASCEKCWNDSYYGTPGDQGNRYIKLVRSRNCTPEEQAGDGKICPSCNRKTIHMYAKICMNPACIKYGEIAYAGAGENPAGSLSCGGGKNRQEA